jgi:hypothetical protein
MSEVWLFSLGEWLGKHVPFGAIGLTSKAKQILSGVKDHREADRNRTCLRRSCWAGVLLCLFTWDSMSSCTWCPAPSKESLYCPLAVGGQSHKQPQA